MSQNPVSLQLPVAAVVDIDEATRDFASLDLLRPRFSPLRQLMPPQGAKENRFGLTLSVFNFLVNRLCFGMN